jgi:hypothetical protein
MIVNNKQKHNSHYQHALIPPLLQFVHGSMILLWVIVEVFVKQNFVKKNRKERKKRLIRAPTPPGSDGPLARQQQSVCSKRREKPAVDGKHGHMTWES